MKNYILLFCFIVPVKSFLTITQQASKGRTAVLECEYPTGTTVVQWSRVGIGILTTCNIPGTCLPIENNRYSSNVSRSISNFILNDSRYEEDTGPWTCTVNSTEHSRVATVQVIVSTLPSSFHFVKGPGSQIIIPDEGLDLEAKAVCVYPKPNDVYLYYKIKGDDTFNLFQKRSAKIYFAPGKEQNCAVHEYELLAKFNIQKEDFLDLTLSFRIQYKALTGADVFSEATPYVVFPGYPCQSQPCKNGGTCRVLSFTHYTCSCVDRYTGKNCETPVNPCVSNPCQNYGVCHGNKDHYTFQCRCEDGFHGKTCEAKDETSGSYRKVVLQNCNASLSVSEYASDGTRGSLRCDFYIQKSTIHVVWYREENVNITTCNYPGHCELPRNPRYEAFIYSRYSTFVISEAGFYKDDGRWFCKVNGMESSTNFTVTSIPSSFRFTSPRESGIFVPNDGLILNATATCLYPKPSIVNLQYRIQGNKHYNNFNRREADIQYYSDGTSNCFKHQSIMIVTTVLYSTDFHFERDTNVLFQFSYRLQSGKEKNTEEVIDLKFSNSREMTSTICVNCESEISTQSESPGNFQNNSLSSLEIFGIAAGVIIPLIVLAVVLYKCRKRIPPCSCNPFCYKSFENETPEDVRKGPHERKTETRENSFSLQITDDTDKSTSPPTTDDSDKQYQEKDDSDNGSISSNNDDQTRQEINEGVSSSQL